MDNTKIIFFDIDGTLIDMEKKCVTEKMLETLRRLQEKGIGINKVLEYYGIDKSQAMLSVTAIMTLKCLNKLDIL